MNCFSTEIHLLVCIWYAWNNAGLFYYKVDSRRYTVLAHLTNSDSVLKLILYLEKVISQLYGSYLDLIIQVLIYLRKSTFYRRVEEWNWWWSRIIKFSYTIVYLCQDIATISELFLLLLSCTKGLVLLLSALLSTNKIYPINRYISTAIQIVNIMLYYSST